MLGTACAQRVRVCNSRNSTRKLFWKTKEMDYICKTANAATREAHLAGGVPILEVVMPDLDERSLGALIYFFEMSCALSGFLLGVNPFNQPGVEAYKNRMFELLGKPGYEK